MLKVSNDTLGGFSVRSNLFHIFYWFLIAHLYHSCTFIYALAQRYPMIP